MKFRAIKKNSIPKQIVEYIFDLILQGKAKDNDQLPSEREISRDLSISRSALREGMSILKLVGLIEIRGGQPHICFENKKIFRKQIEFQFNLMKDYYYDLLEMIRFLEIDIAGLAAEGAEAKDIELLEVQYKKMQENQNNLSKYIQNNINFRILLAKSTHNLILLDIYESLREILSQYQQEIFREDEQIKKALSLYLLLIDAIKEKDKEKAMKIMEEHIKLSENAFRKYVDLEKYPPERKKFRKKDIIDNIKIEMNS